MVSVLLMGGMGNQMFQYAFGRSLADEAGCKLHLDTSFLKRRDMPDGFVYRNYDLDLFNVRGEVGEDKFFEQHINVSERSYHYDMWSMTKARLSLKMGKNVVLNGFWQSPKYFNKNFINVLDDFSFIHPLEAASEKIKLLAEKIKSKNSIMVNIRRADYLDNNFHGVLGLDYIERAIHELNILLPNSNYFVFSDDIDWCIENINIPNMTIVDHSYKGDRFSYYLQLMKLCDHAIIPNSTFAWWAAYLNQDLKVKKPFGFRRPKVANKKIVVAPIKWFTSKSIDSSDLIPSNWIRL